MTPGRFTRWLNDGGSRRLLRNAGTLIFGNAMTSAIGLVSVAITARGLGPEAFGKLVIAVAYTTIVTQVIAFQSWQAVIRFGTTALVANDAPRFIGVVKAGLVLDVLAALVATVIALAGVWFAGDYIGISAESRSVAQLFSIAILANVIGTPTGLLRLFDRYRSFVVQAFLASLVKLLLVGAAYFADGGLLAFAVAWVVAQVFGNLFLIGIAVREFVKRRYTLAAGDRIIRTFRAHPDLAGFFMLTNLSTTARAFRELDVPILGWLLGPGASGTFRIARQIAGALNKMIDAFYVVVYPDLAKLHFTGQTATALRLARRSGLVLGALVLVVLMVFIMVGEPLLVLVLGDEFRGAYPAAVWCVAGAVIWAFAHPISPLLMVYARHSALLFINVVTSVLYVAAVAAIAPSLGVVGAAAAYAGFLLVWAILSVRLLVTTVARSGGALEPGSPPEVR